MAKEATVLACEFENQILVFLKYIFLGESWGIELCGEGPTEIRRVRAGGPADYAGLQAGDIVLMANGINVTRFGHQESI